MDQVPFHPNLLHPFTSRRDAGFGEQADPYPEAVWVGPEPETAEGEEALDNTDRFEHQPTDNTDEQYDRRAHPLREGGEVQSERLEPHTDRGRRHRDHQNDR